MVEKRFVEFKAKREQRSFRNRHFNPFSSYFIFPPTSSKRFHSDTTTTTATATSTSTTTSLRSHLSTFFSEGSNSGLTRNDFILKKKPQKHLNVATIESCQSFVPQQVLFLRSGAQNRSGRNAIYGDCCDIGQL